MIVKQRKASNWRKSATSAALLFALLIPTIPAQASTKTLGLMREVQAMSSWCWATSAKMVARYLGGTNATQCQYVKWGKASSQCLNVSGDFGLDLSRALMGAGIRGVGTTSGPISFNSIKSQIDARKPIIIRWEWNSGGGHMIAINVYNTTGSTVTYVDPLDGENHTRPYSWIKNGSNHTWTHSRYNISL